MRLPFPCLLIFLTLLISGLSQRIRNSEPAVLRRFLARQLNEAQRITNRDRRLYIQAFDEILQRSRSRNHRRVVRKEYRAMTDRERNRFHRAVMRLFDMTTSRGSSMHDAFAAIHVISLNNAHRGAAFLGWHREFLKIYEDMLQEIDERVAIPYWASHLDRLLPNPSDSILWGNMFLGTGEGSVTRGPFARIRNIHGNRLTRNLGAEDGSELPTQESINYISSRSRFRDHVRCHDTTTEYTHDLVHMYIGGDMASAHSPSDPIFYMHHAFFDCLWEESRERSNSPSSYRLPGNDACVPGQGASNEMSPFNMRNSDALSSSYTRADYSCESIPTCSNRNRNCGNSGYLFCDFNRNLCLPKVRIGGACSGLERYDSCFTRRSGMVGRCVRGVCRNQRPPQVTTPPPRIRENRGIRFPSYVCEDERESCENCCRYQQNRASYDYYYPEMAPAFSNYCRFCSLPGGIFRSVSKNRVCALQSVTTECYHCCNLFLYERSYIETNSLMNFQSVCAQCRNYYERQ